jgi:hypothetical protein
MKNSETKGKDNERYQKQENLIEHFIRVGCCVRLIGVFALPDTLWYI